MSTENNNTKDLDVSNLKAAITGGSWETISGKQMCVIARDAHRNGTLICKDAEEVDFPEYDNNMEAIAHLPRLIDLLLKVGDRSAQGVYARIAYKKEARSLISDLVSSGVLVPNS